MGPGSGSHAMERETICFPRRGTQDVMHKADEDFQTEIDRLYEPAESDALEAVMKLKAHLQTLSTEHFWEAITEGISDILGAEMSFIFKRILVDDQDAAVEMPPVGEPGSCLMATAFHYCSRNNGSKVRTKETKFSAYGCPCAYMRHDKVFLIPEKLNDFITNNPNKLPTPAEAYIAVPLFAEGKCFAHFGAMWSKESVSQKRLSWASIEMLLHSLEDMILQRFLEGSNFIRTSSVPEKRAVIPHDAVTVAQSLRPYAGSLSHELRTPMQGVVGMLDVMYATVIDAVETQTDPKLRKIFEDLKENIEVVQDSSRRAVEAADNVVHAYDMDMSIPDAPPHLSFDELDSASPYSAYPPDRRPEIFVAGSNLPLSRKRRREDGSSRHTSDASTSKFRKFDGVRSAWSKHPEPSQELKDGLQEAEEVQSQAYPGATPADAPIAEDADFAAMSSAKRMVAPGLRHTNMREVIQYVINEGLKLGGRPDSALTREKEHGEVIEVRSRGSDGSAKTKMIEWSVDPNMPHTLFTDEKDLSKLISCVFLNAIKFTNQEGGHVAVHARLSSRGRYITITISDNGPGIPAAFLPRLFKPFSRENESITRQSEGLGLGLMVAKGIARKLGGDLMCTRAETEGPGHGSEFEIKVPVRAGETISRPSSPFGSPMPRGATLAPLDVPKTPPFPPLAAGPRSPNRHAWTLQDMVSDNNMPSTPPSPKSQLIPEPLPPVTITSSPPTPPNGTVPRPRIRKSVSYPEIDRDLANKYPLKFLVAEDNKINRKLLVSMLTKFGYKTIHEAHDGVEAVRQMSSLRKSDEKIDVILMDLWMPLMDGYEAAERILKQESSQEGGEIGQKPTVLAVTADVTDGAQERAARVGMKGFMTKPYKMHDLQRLITEYCAQRRAEVEYRCTSVPMVVEG